MGLKDGLKTPENVLMFAQTLLELLYGDGEYLGRFENFADCLEKLDATIDGHFEFVMRPELAVVLEEVRWV